MARYKNVSKLGGLAVKEKYGEKHFSEMGKKGVEVIKKDKGDIYFADLAQKMRDAKKAKREAKLKPLQ